jgi:hypothetical protein
MSQIGPNVPLFELDQDHIVIDMLLALRTGLGNRNLSRSTKQFKQIYDLQIHQHITRIDVQQTGSRIKTQLLTTTLMASHTFHRTPFMRDQESTVDAL